MKERYNEKRYQKCYKTMEVRCGKIYSRNISPQKKVIGMNIKFYGYDTRETDWSQQLQLHIYQQHPQHSTFVKRDNGYKLQLRHD